MICFSLAIDLEPKVNRVQTKGVDNVQTLTQVINNTFKIALKKFQKKEMMLVTGDYVLARMKGYAPWPGKIISFTKDRSRCSCYFFGSHNNGSVNVKEIVPFVDGFDTIRLISLRRLKEFEKGIIEIELENGIPEHLSSLRQTEAIE